MSDAILDPKNKELAASNPYLNQGATETVDSLRNRFAGLIQQGGFGGGGADGPLANKINALGAEQMGDMDGSMTRGMPLIYADRQRGFKGVSDANLEVIRQRELLEKQRDMARTAKRKAMQAGVRSLAGAAIGGPVLGGGAAGAMIGGGAGGLIGSGG